MDFALIVAGVSLLIGLTKGGMGAVLAVLIIPLLTLVMPVPDAVSLSLPLLLIGDVFAIWMYWKTWDTRHVKLMIPFAIIGILVGTTLLATLPDLTLRRLVAAFTLLFVGFKLIDERLTNVRYEHRNWHAYLAGGVSGVGSALANVGAPPFTAYLLMQDLSPQRFVGTTTLYFAFINVLKLPGLVVVGLLDLNDLIGVVWALPLIPLGVWLGRWMVDRLNRKLFERFMLVVLVIASFALLLIPPR